MSGSAMQETARIAAARDAAAIVLQRCALLAGITEISGEIRRTFLSAAMDEAHAVLRPWMAAAGMAVRVDRAGNLRGVYAAEQGDAAPRLVIGSHLDTVPHAGAYDGVLGVMLGLALVEACAGRRFPFAIELIGFSDEEGTRFGVPFIGSRALVGELSDALLAATDGDGVCMKDALQRFCDARPEVAQAQMDARAAGYLEFHIEQGPVLESGNLSLGIVEAIAGQSRMDVTFRGRAGHAGTTPMLLRKDALAGAAEWMTRVEQIAGRFEQLVATVGRITAEPGAVNVIPGAARCTLDVRHALDEVREAGVRAILAEAETIAARRGLTVESRVYHEQAAVHLDEPMIVAAASAARAAGHTAPRMTSGAGHDAMVMAPHLPAVMIFLRSPGGVSHHPEESVLEADVAAAIHTGLCFLDEFALLAEKKGASTLA